MKNFSMLLIAFILLILAIIEFAKEVKSIRTIKATFHDENIKAIVVDIFYVMPGGRKPVLQYSIDGIEKKYMYHFYCDPQKYPKGKEVTLKLSKESGSAYSKTDLRKAFFWGMFEVLFCFGCVIACFDNLFF